MKLSNTLIATIAIALMSLSFTATADDSDRGLYDNAGHGITFIGEIPVSMLNTPSLHALGYEDVRG